MLSPRSLERYSREIMVREVGREGLERLRSAKVAIVGCGALGSAEAELMVRAGVGYVKVVDGDYVDVSNLPRTHLFTWEDSVRSFPKAIACSLRLREIEPESKIDPIVEHVDSTNIEEVLSDVDLILDGTDNMETRMLINEFSVKTGTPWIYAAVEEWYGMVMAVIPRKTPCLRCVIDRYPELTGSRCEAVGVMGTAATLVATLAANEGLKYILGLDVSNELIYVDTLRTELKKFKVVKDKECPVCSVGILEHLNRKVRVRARRLCGSPDIVVYPPEEGKKLDIFNRAKKVLKTEHANPYTIKLKIRGKDAILFPDGKAIIRDVKDKNKALELYEELVRALM